MITRSRNKMSTHLLGKNPSTTDFLVVGLCRPPSGAQQGHSTVPITQWFHSSPSHSITGTAASSHLSLWFKSWWQGLGEDEANVSPSSKAENQCSRQSTNWLFHLPVPSAQSDTPEIQLSSDLLGLMCPTASLRLCTNPIPRQSVCLWSDKPTGQSLIPQGLL